MSQRMNTVIKRIDTNLWSALCAMSCVVAEATTVGASASAILSRFMWNMIIITFSRHILNCFFFSTAREEKRSENVAQFIHFFSLSAHFQDDKATLLQQKPSLEKKKYIHDPSSKWFACSHLFSSQNLFIIWQPFRVHSNLIAAILSLHFEYKLIHSNVITD